MRYFLAAAITLLWAGSLMAAPVDLLADGYQNMYGLRFDAAHMAFQAYERANPADPMGPASDAAAYLFFELDRLKVLRSEFFSSDESFFAMKRLNGDPKVKRDFEVALARTKLLSDAMLHKQPDERDAMLADVLRIALQADYLALIEKDNLQSLAEIKQARAAAELVIKKHPDCFDAYLPSGIENYLLSQKVAPVRFILRITGAQTDKQNGISKLRLVAEKGRYWKPYSKILLAIADLRDGNRKEAVDLLKELSVQFPSNDLFRDELKKLCEPGLAACGGVGF